MVEALVAMSLIVVGLLGVFTLLSRSLSLNRVIANQYAGVMLASEGIELAKNLLDHNVLLGNVAWNSGIADGEYESDYNDLTLSVYADRFLDFDSGSGVYSYDAGPATNFKRKITIKNDANGQSVQVITYVNWITRGGGESSIQLEDTFFNWR